MEAAALLSQSTLIATTMPEQLSEAHVQQPEGAVQGQLCPQDSTEIQDSGVQGLQAPPSFQGGQLEQPLAGAAVEQAGVAGQAPAMLGGLGQADGGVEAKRSICFDFTKNQCTRGAACKFSHDVGLIITVNSQEKGICFDFLKGLCTRGLLCRFSHDLRNLQTPQCTASSVKKRFAPICYDFVKNQCTRGEECKYSHDYSSILYGPRAPGKDPYVICVDFTRGKCARGASCRYSHVDPRMLSAPALPTPGAVHPALLAAGLGAAAAAAAVAQTSAMPGAIQGALAGLNAATVRQSSELQAQAALLLSGLGGNGLLGAGLPSTPMATGVAPGTIPAAWSGLPGMQQQGSGPSMQQSPAEIAALLEQLQRTALTDSLAQLSPTAGDAASLSNAFNALISSGSGGNISPTYSSSLDASQLAAAGLLQGQPSLDQQQAAAAAAYRHGSADTAALLQPHLSDSSQLNGIPGSAGSSAAPTPTAAGAMPPTIFSQPRVPSPPMDQSVPAAPTPRGPSPAPLPPKSQPLMPMYHPLLQQKPAPAFRADILVDARSGTGSPTIGANWGSAAGPEQHQQHSALGEQLKQQGGLGLPPPPPPIQVTAAPQRVEQLPSAPHEMASSFEQMQLLWGQRTIWGQRQ